MAFSFFPIGHCERRWGTEGNDERSYNVYDPIKFLGLSSICALSTTEIDDFLPASYLCLHLQIELLCLKL